MYLYGDGIQNKQVGTSQYSSKLESLSQTEGTSGRLAAAQP